MRLRVARKIGNAWLLGPETVWRPMTQLRADRRLRRFYRLWVALRRTPPCPRCNGPREIRMRMFFYRGQYFSGIVCPACNSLHYEREAP